MKISTQRPNANALDESAIKEAILVLTQVAQTNTALVRGRLQLAGLEDVYAPDEIAITGAISQLKRAAKTHLAHVKDQLVRAGLEIAGDTAEGTLIATGVGQLVPDRGIYHGPWQPRPGDPIVQAYSDEDFLKDDDNKDYAKDFDWWGANDGLTRQNGGRRYGEGTETDLCKALAKAPGTKGAYLDGDRVLGPVVLLNGMQQHGSDWIRKARAGWNTFDLLNGSDPVDEMGHHLVLKSSVGPCKRIIETVLAIKEDFYKRPYPGQSSWSCSPYYGDPELMLDVNLGSGHASMHSNSSGVLPFRFYRTPHPPRAISHLKS